MNPKNTICLWFDKEAHEAARFYAATFPDSAVTAVHTAPSDYPNGKQGDVLTVEFNVLGIPCLGRWPAVQAQRRFFLPDRDGQSRRDGPLLERHRRQRRPGECLRVVQGPLGPLLADHSACAYRRPGGGGR
jgi:3-demethylubiquinone-9 3-methyltransferase